MDKEYMLQTIKIRIKELEKKYREYFSTDNGPSSSKSGAACMRSRIKKDLDVLKLLEALLMYCPATMVIDNENLERVFNRLTEPRGT